MSTEESLLLFELYDLIGSTTILGVLCGIAFSLYCLCAWPLYLNLQNPDKRHRAKFLLGYISFLFVCAASYLALCTRAAQLAYIDHADFPGGPFVYELSYGSAAIHYEAAFIILDFTIETLTMAVQVRRLWIIWSGTRYAVVVTVLPVLLLLGYIALTIPVNIVGDFVPLTTISNKSAIAMTTAMYFILSGFTALVTGLIAARLLFARKQFTTAMGMSDTTSPYLGIVAMLVETYALEFAWSLVAAILYASGNASELLFVTNDCIIKIITYFLIVYRVERGWGWTKHTEEKLTSLQWNHAVRTDETSSLQS